MNKFTTTALSITLLTSIATAKETFANFPYKLTKTYETTGFENPESIVVDTASKALYVSNVNGAPTEKAANGYISKVALDGTIITKKWITGLDAPKGIALHQGKLYIADIDTLVIADAASGKIIAKHQAEGATFLNDVAADPKTGDIYVSNTFGKSLIYKFSKGKISLFMEGEKLSKPNGLSVENGKLLIANWGKELDPKTYETKTPGSLLSIDLKTKSITPLSSELGNLDGIAPSLHGHFITDWIAGQVYYRTADKGTLYNALTLKKGAADLYFDKSTKTLIIPLMLDNKIQAYKLSK